MVPSALAMRANAEVDPGFRPRSISEMYPAAILVFSLIARVPHSILHSRMHAHIFSFREQDAKVKLTTERSEVKNPKPLHTSRVVPRRTTTGSAGVSPADSSPGHLSFRSPQPPVHSEERSDEESKAPARKPATSPDARF